MSIKCAPHCKGKFRGKCQPCFDFEAKQNLPICFKDRFYTYRDSFGFIEEKDKSIENFTYFGLDLFVRGTTKNYWLVIEGKSGAVVQYGNSKKDAINNSKKIIKSLGKVEVENKIDDFVKDHGLSPRYQIVK